MKIPLLLLPVTLGIASFSFGQGRQSSGPPPRPEVARLSAEVEAKTKFLNPEYLVFSPELEDSSKPVPLVVYLHGGGGLGSEILRVKGPPGGVFRAIEFHGHAPCIVVAPQCRRGEGGKGGWIAEDLNLLLEQVKATLPIDATRVYVTGNSMGGYGCWMWAGTNPEHFAAAAPVVGGIGEHGPKHVSPHIEAWAKKLAKIPVWAFAGGQDGVVPAERSERMIDLIEKAGGTQAKITVFPEAGHNAGKNVFNSGEFYDWLFGQRKE